MGSYKGSFKGPFEGIYRDSIRVLGLGCTWRFMGIVISGVLIRITMVITPIRGLIPPFITHEPPSKVVNLRFKV